LFVGPLKRVDGWGRMPVGAYRSRETVHGEPPPELHHIRAEQSNSAMSETSWEALRERFIVKYESFRARLRRRLGSDDMAQESLQETWLQLAKSDGTRSVLQPDSYLFGIALNMAAGLRRAEIRYASRLEIEAATEIADEAAGPDKIVEAQFDLQALERAIGELPPRRRVILLAVRLQDVPIQTLADTLGLSRRMVEIELKRAIEYCAGRLDRPVTRRFGPKPAEPT
jgi:RNA polymerase sigma factor (sigma-70 family)